MSSGTCKNDVKLCATEILAYHRPWIRPVLPRPCRSGCSLLRNSPQPSLPPWSQASCTAREDVILLAAPERRWAARSPERQPWDSAAALNALAACDRLGRQRTESDVAGSPRTAPLPPASPRPRNRRNDMRRRNACPTKWLQSHAVPGTAYAAYGSTAYEEWTSWTRNPKIPVHNAHFVHSVHAHGGLRGRLAAWGDFVKQLVRGVVGGVGGRLQRADLGGLLTCTFMNRDHHEACMSGG